MEMQYARSMVELIGGTPLVKLSAVTAGLAQGMSLRDAVLRARAYVRAAIAGAPGFGRGHGPLQKPVAVAADVFVHERADVCVDDGRRRSLVLALLAEDLARQ